MTSFTLKIIALITMFIDHSGYVFVDNFSFCNFIGRIAFPIFAFQISKGYKHTKNLKKYFLRLGIFALISQIPFSLFTFKYHGGNILNLNVFFTLFLGLLSIFLYDYVIKLFNNNKTNTNNSKNKKIIVSSYIFKAIGIIIVLLLGYVAKLLNTDYGFWGVLVVFIFYLFNSKKLLMTIAFFILCMAKYFIPYINSTFSFTYLVLGLCTFLPIVFITSYNGKQGPKIKYLLYIFYPLHLLILYLL